MTKIPFTCHISVKTIIEDALKSAGYEPVFTMSEQDSDVADVVEFVQQWEQGSTDFSMMSYDAFRQQLIDLAIEGKEITIEPIVTEQIRYNGLNIDFVVRVDGEELENEDHFEEWMNHLTDFVCDNMCGDYAKHTWRLFLPFLLPANPTDEMLAFFKMPNVHLKFFVDEDAKYMFSNLDQFKNFMSSHVKNQYEYTVEEGLDS